MSEATFEHVANAYRSALEEHASLNFVTAEDAVVARRVTDEVQHAYLSIRATEAGRLLVESMAFDSRPRVAFTASCHALAWDSEVAKTRLGSFLEEGEPYAAMARIALDEWERGEEFVRGSSWKPSS